MSGKNELRLTNLARREFLAAVASMYYEQGMTQQHISNQLGYSRSAVSRFLTEAREAGIVEIRIRHPLVRSSELETAVRARFEPREVRVLSWNSLDYSQMLRRLGELGARLVEENVSEEAYLGVSWGTGVYAVANALQPPRYPDVRVIQLIGSLGTPNPEIDGPELARRFGQLYGGSYRTLPAPLIVDSEAVRNALMSDSRIRETLDLALQAKLAVVGIGTTEPSMSSLVRAGYLTLKENDEVIEGGAVGDVCSIHFDIDGNVLDLPIARRVVGVQADDLRGMPYVLGVAGGEVKAPAILGALRSGLVNALVTDEATAKLVLALDQDST